MQSQFSVARPDGSLSHLVVKAEENLPASKVNQLIAHTINQNYQPLNYGIGRQARWATLKTRQGAIYRFQNDSYQPLVRQEAGIKAGQGRVYIKQVSGQGAGTFYCFGPGKVSLGADPQAAIQIPDHTIARTAALVNIDDEGRCTVEKTSSSCTVYLDGKELEGQQTWEPGSLLRIGDYLYEVDSSQQVLASLTPAQLPGFLDYNRPPRLLPGRRSNDFKYPNPPEAAGRTSLPLLAMLLPLLLAIVMATSFKQPHFLLFGIMSPVMMLASTINNRKTGKVTFREKKAKYRKTVAMIDQDLEQAIVDFASEKRMLSPDPASIGMLANLPSARLWERRRTDPDHLAVRVGLFEAVTDIKLFDPEEVDHRRTKYPSAADVPATLSLPEYGVIGICGPDLNVHRSAAWMLTQLAVLQSPRDLSLVLLTEGSREKEWHWSRWLPHMKNHRGAVANIGNSTASIGQRISEILALMDSRQAENEGKPLPAHEVTATVVIFDGIRKLRQWPGVCRILSEGPALGIYSICIDSEERLLPEESRAIILAQEQAWTIQRDRQKTLENITPDLPDWPWFEWVCRALAPLRDVSEEAGSAIPASSRYLSLVNLVDPDADLVLKGWRSNPRSTKAILGETFDGPLSIDIRQDGPHALIAGTTGSGKSELLQTLIASLALNNRPDELNFVLIDYKGGAAFKDFVNLPHTVGNVTDLDGHLVERAMQSLSAELRRREQLLASVGAKDIEDFTAARERGQTRQLLPRLLLVVDEFAALKAELPEFVSGIVGIAQRGRSLGIHLVLATQRPQGSITADILANTNLRIALRMADANESRDVIASQDAAEISSSTPGRAYVRSGSNALLPFQTARIGGLRPDTANQADLPEPEVYEVPWQELGENLPVAEKREEEQTSALTDLQVLVEAIAAAADKGKIQRQPSPWLDALRTHLLLADCSKPAEVSQDGALAPVTFGMQDYPEEQAQKPLLIDFSHFSHLYLVGAPRSGRTQALRTIAGALCKQLGSNDAHLYGIDFGSGGLRALEQLPQCGCVISRSQGALLARFVKRMEAELASRRTILGQSGFLSVDEQRLNSRPEDRLPHIFILFDQWEGFIHGEGEDLQNPVFLGLLTLLREGASVGIHLIIAGDRSLLASRTNNLVERKLVMRLADRSDYMSAGLNPRQLPSRIPAGRVFESDTGREGQIALLAKDSSSQGQLAALEVIAQWAKVLDATAPSYSRPLVFHDLPTSLTFQDLAGLGQHTDPWRPVLGVGGDQVGPIALDLRQISTFLVGGPSRCGKSNLLLTLARSMLAAGGQVVLLTPARSPLRQLAGQQGVLASYRGSEITAEVIREVCALEGVTVVIDDASALTDFAVLDALKGLNVAAERENFAVIVADGLEELERVGPASWLNILAKNRHGAVFNPTSTFSGRPFGLNFTRQTLSQSYPVGRALLNRGDGQIVPVQIPYDA